MTDTLIAPEWAQPGTDLSGSTVVVVGGAGGVGEGIVRALLVAGATVVATSRSAGRLEEFARRIDDPRLHVRELDLLDPSLSEEAAALATEFGGLHGVVISVADWGRQGRKPLLELTDPEWEDQLRQNQTTVFRAYRAFVPLLDADGMILQLNGLSADLPFPLAAAVAAGSAATKSLTRTLAAELDGRGPRVYELVLGFIRTRPRRLAGIDDPNWIPATDVGVHVAEVAAATSPIAGHTLHYFIDQTAGPRAAADQG
ncbi:SDR family NAD(P)-dependent oxidoreductase [Actinoplanes sp. TRM 88003]|uniref:SDR family NAD(P)-dependent oxidoreductase n=1 Tax=Paractinoplanes aksuensis TaxID=2939490 RepID=A0ABT1E342_9ACTN|nr:SDR family NAD(P)-dependent oxidoreductase [Actinoplanes aksuensis]MCO8277554.1 SDR family NAD(P)-dependent oxidoreductase [Actinoplanes aksuensis]